MVPIKGTLSYKTPKPILYLNYIDKTTVFNQEFHVSFLAAILACFTYSYEISLDQSQT